MLGGRVFPGEIGRVCHLCFPGTRDHRHSSLSPSFHGTFFFLIWGFSLYKNSVFLWANFLSSGHEVEEYYRLAALKLKTPRIPQMLLKPSLWSWELLERPVGISEVTESRWSSLLHTSWPLQQLWQLTSPMRMLSSPHSWFHTKS